MPSRLAAAADYLPRWLEFQLRLHEQPGCVVALAHRGRLELEAAFGYADAAKRKPLTPRHRFRVASHSKSFTAAGIVKLQQQKKLRLQDEVGRYVQDLHPAIARVTLGELLSHSAGLVRDGGDSGQFSDRRPFLNKQEVLADLQAPPTLRRGTRFKYSNHGYALLGMAIEAITGEPYRAWIAREIVDAAGLAETVPDMPLARGTPFARGHTGRLPVGERLVIPGDFSTHAIAPAGGFVSTAADSAIDPYQQHRRPRPLLDGRRDARPAYVCAPRPPGSRASRLARPLVDDVERGRSRADARPGARGDARVLQPVHGRIAHQARPHRARRRLRQPRRAGAPWRERVVAGRHALSARSAGRARDALAL
jgi:CubicO group peptidase (beta-lactamase class C family)